LYDFNSNKLLESLDIFRGARIHGIQYSLQNRTLIVFGGKLLALVSFNDSETTLPRLGFTLKFQLISRISKNFYQVKNFTEIQ
jgi:hypothetical protein